MITTHREPPKEKMNYAEFLAWADEDTLAEWVDGEVIMIALTRTEEIGGL